VKIKTSELLEVIDILKKNILMNHPSGVDIDNDDYYWEIPENEIYNPSTQPNDLTLGQLSEDWKELLRLKEKESIPISYDLKRLAVILQVIRKESVGKW